MAWREVMRELYGLTESAAALVVKDASGKGVVVDGAASASDWRCDRVRESAALCVRVRERTISRPNGKRVGYIAFNIWMPALGERIDAAVDRFRQYDGIGIDLRGNPGGLAAMISGVGRTLY
jgi:C-terminal processing protease CtpA/Prc